VLNVLLCVVVAALCGIKLSGQYADGLMPWCRTCGALSTAIFTLFICTLAVFVYRHFAFIVIQMGAEAHSEALGAGTVALFLRANRWVLPSLVACAFCEATRVYGITNAGSPAQLELFQQLFAVSFSGLVLVVAGALLPSVLGEIVGALETVVDLCPDAQKAEVYKAKIHVLRETVKYSRGVCRALPAHPPPARLHAAGRLRPFLFHPVGQHRRRALRLHIGARILSHVAAQAHVQKDLVRKATLEPAPKTEHRYTPRHRQLRERYTSNGGRLVFFCCGCCCCCCFCCCCCCCCHRARCQPRALTRRRK
jgi:hypothetical protein